MPLSAGAVLTSLVRELRPLSGSSIIAEVARRRRRRLVSVLFYSWQGARRRALLVSSAASCASLSSPAPNRQARRATPPDLDALERLQAELLASATRVEEVVRERRSRERECPVCMLEQKDTVLVPCGHQVCDACSRQIRACPMCNQPFVQAVRTF